MIIGAFWFDVCDLYAGMGSAIKYDTEADTHIIKNEVSIYGKVQSRPTAAMLINGKRRIDGLPIRISVTAGNPVQFENFAEHQTQPPNSGPRLRPEVIKSTLGGASFLPALEDRELNIKGPDSLEVEVSLPDAAFSDLWNWVRTPGTQLRHLRLELFGPGLQLQPDGGDYHWTISKPANNWLYVASLSYGGSQSGGLKAEPAK